MIDSFIDEIFISNAIGAALGHNSTYTNSANPEQREAFRKELAKQLRNEAKRKTETVADDEHCRVIERISASMSDKHGHILKGGRLRYGTTQKAFNLYLKFLWRAGHISEPPHCPIDSIVLREAGIDGSWTKLDCKRKYLKWINEIRKKAKAKGRSIAQWERCIWLKNQEIDQ